MDLAIKHPRMFTTVLNLSTSLDRRDSVGGCCRISIGEMPGIRRLLVSGFEADRLRNAKITYGTQSVALRRVDDVAAVCRPAGSHVGVEALFFIDVGDGFTQFLQLRLQMLAFFGKDFLTFRYR